MQSRRALSFSQVRGPISRHNRTPLDSISTRSQCHLAFLRWLSSKSPKAFHANIYYRYRVARLSLQPHSKWNFFREWCWRWWCRLGHFSVLKVEKMPPKQSLSFFLFKQINELVIVASKNSTGRP
jgi:hypothetical protein